MYYQLGYPRPVQDAIMLQERMLYAPFAYPNRRVTDLMWHILRSEPHRRLSMRVDDKKL